MKRGVFVIVLAVVLVAGLGYVLNISGITGDRINISGKEYRVVIAKTSEELQRGLSGTKSLPENDVMLFVFPTSDRWSIWMKDMNYAIDIIWIDGRNQVVYMVKNALPSSYPTQKFYPDKPAKYVVELNSGTIEKTEIRLGDHVTLPRGVQ